MQPPTLLAAALLSSAALAPSVDAQAQLTQIGFAKPVLGLSADGMVAVGADYATGNAYAWTPTGGLTQLPGARDAVSASADGSLILGETTTPKQRSAIWDGLSWSDLGDLGASCDAFQANPYDMSDDGTVAVGLGWQGCTTSAYVWTPTAGIQALPKLGTNNARANVVSSDGSTIGGWDEDVQGTRRAVVWWPDGSTELLLVSPQNPAGGGEVSAISQDGTWIAGDGYSGTNMWLYSKATGLQDLGKPASALPGTQGIARWISPDGKTVYGIQGAFGAWRATIWQEGVGMQFLDEYLAQTSGVTLPQNVNITDASADGRVVVGYEHIGPYIEGVWYIELWPESGACGYESFGDGLGAVNALALSGSGSSAVGGLARLVTDDAQGPLVITAGSLGQAQFPIFGGIGLLDPVQLVLQWGTPVNGSGSSMATLAIPADAALSGAQLFFQSFAADAAQPEGLALSNGLQLTVCP